MGERKGQNKYYPPDYNPKAGGLNKFLGTHALRERARKIHLGIIIIRFEMPYNIWCDGCKNHIGMGVRYNAEKTKIGMYYSTPVYQFRMKCHLCDNYFEIKTDPGNLDYVIVSGARRQENRWDPAENEQIVADTKEIQRKLFDDPMFKLEHVANDIKTGENAKPVLGRLFERNVDVWKDNYEANCRLRAAFRSKKKELRLVEEQDNALLARSSLEINLLPENDQDKRLAALMHLQAAKSIVEREKETISEIMNKPALPSATITSFGGLKREQLLSHKLNKKYLGIVKRKGDSIEGVTKKPNIDEDTENMVKIPETINNSSVNEQQLQTQSVEHVEEIAHRQRKDGVTVVQRQNISLVSNYSSNSESEASVEDT